MEDQKMIDEIKKIFPNSGILKDVAKSIDSDFQALSDEIYSFLSIADESQGVSRSLPLILLSFTDYFDAKAYKKGDTELISISKGAIMIIYKFFFMLMSMKSFLPHIGDTKLEVDEKIILENIPLEITDLAQIKQKPKCQKRLAYANFISKVAIFYLFGHEIAHIRRGHFSLNPGIVLFEKFNVDFVTASNRDEMVEIDADSVSANLCMHYLQYIMKNLDKSSENAWIFENKERLIELICAATHFATFLFSNTIEWMTNPESIKKYPPAIARNLNLQAQIGIFCQTGFNMEFSDAAIIVAKIYENFELTLFSLVSPGVKKELKSQLEFY